MKRRRMDLGLRQKDVAAQMGVNRWTIANWEKGKTQAAVLYYQTIIHFLGYNPLPPAGETFPDDYLRHNASTLRPHGPR